MFGVRCLLVSLLCAAGFSSTTAAAGERPVVAVADQIDTAIEAGLAAAKVPLAASADDAEFIRRIYLDLHGVVPPRDRVVAFLRDDDVDKRAKLIDALLADPQYGRHFGLIWYNRMVPRTALARGVVDESFRNWLADRFNANDGWNAIVSDIIQSVGARDENPATNFFLAAMNDDRENPQPAPDKATAAVARLFLGLRLECCQCHNHPFNPLKQTDFWGTAAFFINVRTEFIVRPNSRPNTVPVLHEGVYVGTPKGKKLPKPISDDAIIEIPETGGKTTEARFLHGAKLTPSGEPRFRPALAQWLTAPTNRQFARAVVNRMWANFFGRGLIDPVDDMQPEHPCSHPEVLDRLADEFIAADFDLQHLARCLTNTRVYQRTSTPLVGRPNESELYNHAPARVLTADQLYDSLAQILGHEVGERIANAGQKRKYGDSRERFRTYFQGGGDDDNTPVPAYGHGIPQVLRLMNSPIMTDGAKLITQLIGRGQSTEGVITDLYLTVLSRRPTAEELQRVQDFVLERPEPATGYADLLWVLLNGGEFLHNH